MKNSIKMYFKDYKGVVKHCIDFSKKHWKGTLVLGTIYSGLVHLLIKAYCNRKFKFDDVNIPTYDFPNEESN